jgi:hypothetical protein
MFYVHIYNRCGRGDCVPYTLHALLSGTLREYLFVIMTFMQDFAWLGTVILLLLYNYMYIALLLFNSTQPCRHLGELSFLHM